MTRLGMLKQIIFFTYILIVMDYTITELAASSPPSHKFNHITYNYCVPFYTYGRNMEYTYFIYNIRYIVNYKRRELSCHFKTGGGG